MFAVTGQDIVMIGAAQIFNLVQGVSRAETVVRSICQQIGIYSGRASHVGCRVKPATTGQAIIALITQEYVVLIITGQDISKGRAGEVFNTDQHISGSLTRCSGAGSEADNDRASRVYIRGRILADRIDKTRVLCKSVKLIRARTADQSIGILTAIKLIITRTADQGIVPAQALDDVITFTTDKDIAEQIADQDVVKSRTGHIFDTDQ